jgi:hypothetical protein
MVDSTTGKGVTRDISSARSANCVAMGHISWNSNKKHFSR